MRSVTCRTALATLLGAVTTACQSEPGEPANQPPPPAQAESRPGIRIAPPKLFAQRRLRAERIELDVLIDGRTQRASRDANGNRVIALRLAPASLFPFTLTWSTDAVELATLSDSIRTGSIDSTVVLRTAEAEYTYTDTDNDSFSNLDELDAGTDPLSDASFPGMHGADAGFNSQQQDCLIDRLVSDGLGEEVFRDDYAGTPFDTPPVDAAGRSPVPLVPDTPLMREFTFSSSPLFITDALSLPQAGTLVLSHTGGKPDIAAYAVLERTLAGDIVLLDYRFSQDPLPRTITSIELPAGGYCLIFAARDVTDPTNRWLVPLLTGTRSADDNVIGLEYELIAE